MNEWAWPRVALFIAASVLAGLAVGAALDGDGVLAFFAGCVAVLCVAVAEMIRLLD